MARGRFITLEGGEGVGKSTQAKRLQAFLAERGVPAVLTREPGGAPGAEAIRDLLVRGEAGRWEPMSEALLHTAARVEHIARLVAPALARGEWVISDRYVHSTLVYQGIVQGVGLDKVRAIHEVALDGLMPDLVLILDLPAGEGLARAAARGGPAEDRYERMDERFHERLREGFRRLAEGDPDRCRLIDATGSQEQVAAHLAAAVEPLLEAVG